MTQNREHPRPNFNNSIAYGPIYLMGIAAILYFLFCWFTGIKQVINWQIMSHLGDTKAIVDRFSIAGQAFEIPAKVYFVTEQYIASNMQINHLGSWIWVAIFTVGLSLLSAISTRFQAYYYYVATTFLIILIVSLGVDELFGQSNYLYSGVFLLAFISISYLFNSYFQSANILTRFLAFLFLFLVLGLIIIYFAVEQYPFLLLASKSTIGAIIISLLFIFFIGYDNILAVLQLTTKGSGTNSLLNFSIFSLIYLINIGLTHLHNIKWLNWDMLYLSPYLLLLISIVIGYFQLGKKESTYSSFLPKIIEVKYLFLGLTIITLGLCAYSFSTGNDPAIEAMEDYIVYIHFVMSLCFYAYVFFNFFPLFMQQYDVAKVVFKPLQFGMYYFRAGAILIIFAMLMNNQFFPVMQSFSGYYNSIADHSVASQQYKLAEAYYKTALGYERQNHKSNYGMASLAAIQGDNPTAGSYFRLAIQKKPTAFAFAALSNSLQKEDLFFEAMFALKDGLKIYPKSGELQNNLAIIFEQSKSMDSSYFYLEKAKINAENKDIPKANLISFWIKNGIKNKQIEMISEGEKSKYNALNANILALKLISENDSIATNKYQFNGDSTLNMANFAWLYNQTLSNSKNKKYTEFNFQKFAEKEGNFNLAKDLQTAQIFNEYYAGNKLNALEILEIINTNSDTTEIGKYNQVLFNTLLKKANEIPSQINIGSIITIQEAEKALATDPLNDNIIDKAVAIFNQNKQEKEAYSILLTARHWHKNSPRLQKLYILQCFKMHMLPYAKDEMVALKTTNLTEYNSFLPVYQAQIALVEKANEGFN